MHKYPWRLIVGIHAAVSMSCPTIPANLEVLYTLGCNYYGKCAVEMSLMVAALKNDTHSGDLRSDIYNVLCGENT